MEKSLSMLPTVSICSVELLSAADANCPRISPKTLLCHAAIHVHPCFCLLESPTGNTVIYEFW